MKVTSQQMPIRRECRADALTQLCRQCRQCQRGRTTKGRRLAYLRPMVDPALVTFRGVFSFESWFKALQIAVTPLQLNSTWPGSLRRMALEALSDSSAEQFMNPLVAGHLRRYGADLASRYAPHRWFWARSEWEKVDISYGLSEAFDASRDGWDDAWARGVTGDLGLCEVKVCYTHQFLGRIETLGEQLETRWRRYRLRTPDYRYHGLVWLFQHHGVNDLEGASEQIRVAASRVGLSVRCGFELPLEPDDLERLWPSRDGGHYQCGMSLALLELAK